MASSGHRDETLFLGAVAYDPKVVTIWDGFTRFFAERGLAFDYVLYSNYERQVEGHFRGEHHVAWNSPLAFVEAERLSYARSRAARAVAMRDTDQGLTSVILVRADAPIHALADLRGKRVAVGALDSPQATILPLLHLAENGVEPRDVEVVVHDVLAGKHGDHIGGEREAARALLSGAPGAPDAACILDANLLAFAREGTLPEGRTRVLAQTAPYDHCNFTVLSGAPEALVARFTELLLGMRYDDPSVRPLMDLEGLKAWKPGRTEGVRGAPARVRPLRDDRHLARVGPVTRAALDLGDLDLSRGGHLLVKRALAGLRVGGALAVHGRAPALAVHLRRALPRAGARGDLGERRRRRGSRRARRVALDRRRGAERARGGRSRGARARGGRGRRGCSAFAAGVVGARGARRARRGGDAGVRAHPRRAAPGLVR